MHYFECLRLLKTTFIGGKDKGLVASILDDHFDAEQISILDIGSGDGYYLTRLLKELPAHRLSLTIVEPLLLDAPMHLRSFLPADAEVIAQSFEDCGLIAGVRRFDVVHVRQALYYLKSPEATIRSAAAFVSKGGLLIVNLWSRRCWLRRLHDQLRPDAAVFTAEDALETMSTIKSLGRVTISYREGLVDTGAWRASPQLLEAATRILTRSSPENESSEEDIRRMRELIPPAPANQQRINGIVVGEAL